MGVPPGGGGLISKNKGARTIIICVLGGVTYAEIHHAAEIERRTGCPVLIGGSEVLTPSAYLERLSMQVRDTLHVWVLRAGWLASCTQVIGTTFIVRADVGANDSGRVGGSSAG